MAQSSKISAEASRKSHSDSDSSPQPPGCPSQQTFHLLDDATP
jgi:hypothetical protein